MKRLAFCFSISLIFIGLCALVLIMGQRFLGIPLLKEIEERARRVIERRLPVESVDTRSRRLLDKKLADTGLKLGQPVFIRVFKKEALMEVWIARNDQYHLLHTYPICRFSGFLGPKLAEGDKQSPEGFYSVTAKQLNPGSRHYRAFNIGFPNEYDRAHGRTGSALMVHGGCSSIGCYAMTDAGVGEIYRLVETAQRNGQRRVPVHIFPFRMTDANLVARKTGKWSGFWRNLKQGYDLFEMKKTPPQVSVCGKRYEFGTNSGDQCKLIAGW